jgi:hypothetical protein
MKDNKQLPSMHKVLSLISSTVLNKPRRSSKFCYLVTPTVKNSMELFVYPENIPGNEKLNENCVYVSFLYR